jgi:hypothetical protein
METQRTTRTRPLHRWATVVTRAYTENQGCAKVIALDPGVQTFLTGYKEHVESDWTLYSGLLAILILRAAYVAVLPERATILSSE